jgi:rRNA maturation RNase YbeY
VKIINFFVEEIEFSVPTEKRLQQWLNSVALAEQQEILELNYILCSDEYLLGINIEYLDHDYYTDVITFDNRDETTDHIEGDIFISIDRVRENAKDAGLLIEQELYRVMVHGLLHLLGYRDKSEEEIIQMREKEEAYLSLQKF